MVMLMSWLTVWIMRVLMDYLPVPSLTWLPVQHLLSAAISPLKLALPAAPTPPSMGKYQFAMTMADRIMDGNFRHGHPELVEINRIALSSSFARTLTLLYRSIHEPLHPDSTASWTTRVIRSLPLGSYVVSYARGLNYCLSTFLQTIGSGAWSDNGDDVASEKLAEELLWMTNKLRAYGFVEEALVQWSHAYGLASIALSISPRVQGLILKTSGLSSFSPCITTLRVTG
ncbi:hypothetical protein LINPERPRIM_LOCUS8844 [Linum perenne]